MGRERKREREREKWKLQSFYNLILVDTSYHFRCIMFTRSQPLSLVYTQVEGRERNTPLEQEEYKEFVHTPTPYKGTQGIPLLNCHAQ